MTTAGKPVPHESARGHVTGEALYTDDLLGRFPHLLHAWPVTAPHAHARVKRLVAAPALDEPGVVTTLDAADAPGKADSGPSRHDEPLFPSEVMFHRQPVAWVLGETLDAAQRGAARVQVEYEPLPAILTIQQAIDAGSFLSDEFPLVSRRRLDDRLQRTYASTANCRSEARSTSTWKRRPRSPWVDDTGGVAAQSSTQHPAETQEIHRTRARLKRNQ
jgi:xanthine dehydrogenase large subunit